MNYLQGQIPFGGFYQSSHDIDLDNFCYLFDDGEIPQKTVEAWNCLSDTLDWKSVWAQYIKSVYLPAFEEQLETDILEIPVSEGDIVFLELRSPREYNFEADKITCNISIDLLKKIWQLVQDNEYYNGKFSVHIKELLKPRSGFIPFYSDNPDDWLAKAIEDFDNVEILCLLEALITDEHDNLQYIDCASEHYENCLAAGCKDDQAKKFLYDFLGSLHQE